MNLRKENIHISNKDILNNKINLIFKNQSYNIKPYFCKKMYSILTQYKSLIDIIGNNKKWDYTKKISNDFELINYQGNNSITGLSPLSRSYFKFRELAFDFDLIPNNKFNFRYAALAEGPGGFIESFINIRKKQFLGKEDYIQCISLISKSQDIPNWNKAKEILKLSNINFFKGDKRNGDLYDYNNILQFRNEMNGNTADLVTADGGFDYSINFNKQEQLSYKLIYSEIVCAYGVNKTGGNFILKVFDIFTLPTLKLIYLLSLFYEDIVLTKPFTSRPANSERYIVCKKFKGFNTNIYNNLINNLKSWNPKNIICDINGIVLSKSYLYYISLFNLNLIKLQIRNILKTIIFIKINIECEELNTVRQIQIKSALAWCKKYNIEINYKSKYYNYRNLGY